MRTRLKKSPGFTLIELLVVVAIIGVLATLGVATFGSFRSKARDTTRIANKNQVIKALRMFHADNGRWPVSAAGGSNWSCLGPSSETCWRGGYAGLDSLVTDLAPYLATPPRSNGDSGTYSYNRFLYYSGNGASQAMLIWSTENTMAPADCNSPYAPQLYDKYTYCYESVIPPG